MFCLRGVHGGGSAALMEALVYLTSREVTELPLLGESHVLTRQVRRPTTVVFIDIDVYWAAIRRGPPRRKDASQR